MITIYTDGACKGNGNNGANAGGYGVFIRYEDGSERHIWGGDPDTTNNRMELTAAIIALENTPKESSVLIFTDSQYVQKGISQWMTGWKQKNWKNVKNTDLWQRLDQLCQGRTIDWRWVKGHNGDVGNEMADKLANQGIDSHGNNYLPNPSADPIHPKTSEPIMINDLVTDTDTQTLYDGDTSKANPHFKAILPEPIHQGASDRQLIMDTETTGFEDQNGDRIVEVGIIEMIGRKFTGEKLHVYLNPEKIMDDEVIRVHGISNEFVADKPTFKEVAHKIFEFMKGAEIIAHNAAFDMRFLTMEFDKVGIKNFAESVKVTDSLAIAKTLYPGQKNSLDALVKRLNVGKKDRTFHGALLDSEILAEVYLAMTGGQVALDIEVQEETTNEEIKSEDLSNLNHLLIKSVSDHSADSAWRTSVFG